MKPEVGQKVFYMSAQSRHCKGELVKVTKVGRKYFHCGASLSFDIETWRECGEYVRGKAWSDKKTYDDWRELVSKWETLRKRITSHWEPPAHLTIAQLNHIRTMIDGTPA